MSRTIRCAPAAVLVCMLAACGRGTDTAGKEPIAQVEGLSGMKLPPDSVVLSREEGGRDEPGFCRRIVRSKSAIAPAPGSIEVPADTLVRLIEATVPRPGTARGPQAFVHEWTNPNGSWRASIVETETGTYVVLEQFPAKAGG